jgi:hypothetical protein
MIADAVGTKANNQESSPVFVTNIPRGYRDWRLISVAHEAILKTCFPCHEAVKSRDLVFTRYSP